MHLFLGKTALHLLKLKQVAHVESGSSVVQDLSGCKRALEAAASHVVWLDASLTDLDGLLDYVLNDSADRCSITVGVKGLRFFKQHIKDRFRVVKAAGGLVFKGSLLLFIFRNGYWDLPKGKLDAGESLRACARREVAEECGVSVRVLKPIGRTYHLLPKRGLRWGLKRTDWYQMRLLSDKKMRPQYEEGIQKVEWVSPDQWQMRIQEAYPSIGHIIQTWEKSVAQPPFSI